MNRDFALTLWRADLVRFGLEDRGLKTGQAIIANHAGLLRRYHGLTHLSALFSDLEAHQDQIQDLAYLTYTAWFHDAIYRSWRRDNERCSADWARDALIAMGAEQALAERVHALILCTAHHAQGAPDQDGQLFLDMDCAILGTDPERYDTYARQIRFECIWAPPHKYRQGRKRFLEQQLARPYLYVTPTYRDRYEDQARANLQRELNALTV